MNDQPETFWAWMAGFVDGDGSFGVYANGPNVYPRLTIAQRERGVLDHIVEKVGLGSVARRGRTKTGQVIYAIAFGSKASMDVTRMLVPYLVAKKMDAEQMLMFQHIPKHERKNAPERNPLYSNALSLYEAGKSAAEIGEALSIKTNTVLTWVNRAEITRDYREAQRLRRAREKEAS